ncbi:MAG: phosphate acyltransferase [Acidimicrobiia bacterium]|nr:phosphate acyltransferase [Acidimicrobiia bacterium]
MRATAPAERARGVVAVDAMGGDKAPGAIVSGALAAVAQLGVEVLLAGPPETLAEHLPGGAPPPGVTLIAAEQVISMDDEPAAAVRSKKDSSLVRCVDAVRDGRAGSMVSAGNTGAAMAAALLRLGRIPGVARPAIAVPIPVPGSDHPQLLVDAGATVDCRPEWLAQFAVLGVEYARVGLGLDEPRVGLLSNGEEPGKGDTLRKEAAALLAEVKGYCGNVEGRDLAREGVDVVVTDGFTGNVALKTLEGALQMFAGLVFGVLDSTPAARRRRGWSSRCSSTRRPTSIPTRRAAQCSSASRVSASYRTARRRRGRS